MCLRYEKLCQDSPGLCDIYAKAAKLLDDLGVDLYSFDQNVECLNACQTNPVALRRKQDAIDMYEYWSKNAPKSRNTQVFFSHYPDLYPPAVGTYVTAHPKTAALYGGHFHTTEAMRACGNMRITAKISEQHWISGSGGGYSCEIGNATWPGETSAETRAGTVLTQIRRSGKVTTWLLNRTACGQPLISPCPKPGELCKSVVADLGSKSTTTPKPRRPTTTTTPKSQPTTTTTTSPQPKPHEHYAMRISFAVDF